MSSNKSKEAQAKAEASFKRKEDQARDGKKAAAEYEAERIALRERTAKLKGLRLARDAAAAEAEAEAAKTKPEKKAEKKPEKK